MADNKTLATPSIDTMPSAGLSRADINFEAIIGDPPYTIEEPVRRSTSFNLRSDVFQRFKEKCVANRQSMSQVLEQFMSQYTTVAPTPTLTDLKK